jgi:uncharacterized membrane protein YccC
VSTVLDWFRKHDPNYVALRRAARAAIVMPGLFALGEKVIENPNMSYFLAFGSFAMVLLVDFQGSRSDRLRAQTLLGIACSMLICIGTLVSGSTVLAVIVMFIVGFSILFSGVVSSVIASAATPLVLSFILPVTVPGPASQIPVRVAGWAIAAAVSLFAITFLWPTPVAFPVEGRAAGGCRALAARIRAEIAWVLGDGDDAAAAAYEHARAESDAALGALDKLFLATPYRPTGLSTQARAEIRLVDELRWLSGVVLHSGVRTHPVMRPDMSVCNVKLAAAAVLERAADALPRTAAAAAGHALTAARGELHTALRELEQQTIVLAGDRRQSALGADGTTAVADAQDTALSVVSALDPSFRSQELAYITDQIAANVEFAVAASHRTWFERLLGRQPAGFIGPFSSLRQRALTHASLSSSWLHNSVRGATGLSLAVLVAEITSVQHGFWVVFGTLAVLRSNALSTGQNVLRGLLGTTVGFVIGGVIVTLIGTNTVLLWILLPVAVLCAGLAPSAVSFAAGQAAFTLTLLILFNLLLPEGWRVGLVRVEDVALGGAVSLAVGVLFWPRGAGADLGRALQRAYTDSASYLADAVAYGAACCARRTVEGLTPPTESAQQAAASARRLDDTFRGYLAERGAKKAPLAEMTTLVTGVGGVRLAADAVLELWDGDGRRRADEGDRDAAQQELLGAVADLGAWYGRFGASLTGQGAVPDAAPVDTDADDRLVRAVSTDLSDGDGHSTALGVRVIWTGDHIDAVRRLEQALVGPARTAAGQALR